MSAGPGSAPVSPRRVLWAGTVRNKSLLDRCHAATAGRFDWMTLFPTDVAGWEREGLRHATMRSMLRDAGVRVLAIDPFGQWVPGFRFPDGYPPFLRAHFDFDEADVFRMAEALEAVEINLVEPLRGDYRREYAPGELADAFGQFADRAHARGFRTTLEFMPISSVADLAHGWAIVAPANARYAGLVLDTWHYYRSGSDVSVLETIPGERLFEIQLADAAAAPVGDLIVDLLHHRRPPGDGELDLATLVATLRRIGGYTSVGPEVFSDEFDALSAEEAGRRAGAALDRWS